MIEKNFSQQWQPHIVAIGKLSGSLKAFHLEEKYLQKNDEHQALSATNPPSSIVSQNGVLSVIDQKSNLWVMGNIFYEPVNLSQLTRMKAKTVFLGQGQLLFQNKRKSLILITWGSKPEFTTEKLHKIAINHGPWSHLFEAFSVYEQAQEGSIWHYSTVKKVQNTIKLYHLNKITKEIICFPLKKKMAIPSAPIGISLGKYHGLVWSDQGRLFAWGSKNLGLGLPYYDKSYYDNLQQIVLPQPIVKAYAGINYSIALTDSGNIYEWGNNFKSQMIVSPRILNMKGLKFVSIKGFLNIFGGLTSQNKFYVWGKGIENILGQIAEKQIEEPFQIRKQQNVKILDFEIEENYIIFSVSQDNGTLSNDEKHYFAQVISKVSLKWLPHRAKSRNTQGFRTQQARSPVCTPPELIQRSSDFIDRLVSEHTNKENYFTQIKNQQKFYKKIMASSHSQPVLKFQNSFFHKIKQPSMTPKLSKKTHKKNYTAKDPLDLAFDIQNTGKFIKQMETSLKKQQASVEKIKKMTKSKKQYNSVNNQPRAAKKKTIFLKVQEVQMSHFKTCTQLSTQKRLDTIRILNQTEDFLQNPSFHIGKIAQTFTKLHIMKLLMQAISCGKSFKIKQFKKNQSTDKIYSLSSVTKKKGYLSILSDLQFYKPKLYNKVLNLFRAAIRKWKGTQISKHRKVIVPAIMKSFLKKKLKEGLGSVWLKARKIKIVAAWIIVEQKQRIIQVKSLWKKWLLLYIKPTPTFQNKRPSVCREQLNFKPTPQKGKHIKFTQFVRKSPIFKLKLFYPVSIQKLQSQQLQAHIYARNEVDYSCSKKGVSWAQKHFTQSKFQLVQRDFDKKTTYSTGVVDILPYSYHYNSYFKPKNFQINIPDNMKQCQKWVSEEKRILDELLKEYTRNQWKQFCRNKREYETKLALFIKNNYEYLAEYRWKFIIQYNKISPQQSNKVKKKENQLLRLLKKVDAQQAILKDVIPQRHKMLQYVSLVKGSPTMPQLQIKLTQLEFKRLFKLYYEQISTKSKAFRKFFN